MTKPKFVAGHGYTEADWDEVSDNPEWTAEDFAQAKPFSEVFPEIAAKMKRMRGKQKTPAKKLISLRLNPDTIATFRSLGPGWQGQIDDVLTKAAQKISRTSQK